MKTEVVGIKAMREDPVSLKKLHERFTYVDSQGQKRIKQDVVDQSYKYWVLLFLRDIAESLRRLPVDLNIED